MPLQILIAPAALPMDVAEARLHVRQDSNADDATLLANIRATTTFAQQECKRSLVATRYRLVMDSFPSPNQQSVPWGHTYSLLGNAVQIQFGPILAVKSIKYLDTSSTQQTMPSTDYTVDASGLLGRIAPVFGKIWPISLPQMGAIEIVFDAGDAAALIADPSTDVLTIKGGIWKPMAVGDSVRLSNSGGALPSPLQPDTDYFIASLPTATGFTLSATSGGAAINLTDPGSGTSYIGVVDEGIKAWQKLRLASLYDLRGDLNVLNRGKLESMPYIDRLLDAYTSVLA